MARKHVNDAARSPADQALRGAAKRDLPQKTCVSCGRPFVWRRKWARDWDQVKFCSDRCRARGAGPCGDVSP
ncbi:MAG: DUF2256 domain-containing protein [Brevundimonas sp.]|uniref:DUF2256 domain-containing protein n=1 Tax=Brevundimonas sp. TaxID=1871086 RepID=UPI004034800D